MIKANKAFVLEETHIELTVQIVLEARMDKNRARELMDRDSWLRM